MAAYEENLMAAVTPPHHLENGGGVATVESPCRSKPGMATTDPLIGATQPAAGRVAA